MSLCMEKMLFKSVSHQELVKLRKLIKYGNKKNFLEKVWSNPRYLINSADGPTVLKVRSRYNALHIAIRYKQTELFQAILTTISDLNFLGVLYPNDNMLQIRRSHLLDLYLNMPEKLLSETPLHFACKYGASEILSILLSYPECERKWINKDGHLPIDLIGVYNESCTEGLKKKMQDMFQEEYYVPILRDSYDIQPPVIGEPCGPETVIKAMSGNPFDDDSTNLVPCAFAGPMSYYEAQRFHSIWKTKKFAAHMSYTAEVDKILKDICKSDSAKGLERVGRKLSKDLSTGWVEYWRTLNAWVDLSSGKGLDLLEKHLKSTHTKKVLASSFTKKTIACSWSGASDSLSVTEGELSDEKIFTPPESPKYVVTPEYFLASEFPDIENMFINGSELSDDDIDLFRATENTHITEFHPYAAMWQHLIGKKIGEMYKGEICESVSCTPPLSAAAVRRSLKPNSS